MIDLVPLGDRAMLARFGSEDEAGRWADAVRVQRWPGVLDVVLAYQSAAVYADPDQIDLDILEQDLRVLVPADGVRPSGRLIRIPVLYDGEDLAEAADRLGISEAELIDQNGGQDYQVFAIGFLPGFPYAGYLPPRLGGLPRRDVPRIRVPAGSVAIAGRQIGVYPEASPGGWNLIGRTPLRIVDVERGHFPIRAGDRIRFESIDAREFEARHEEFL